MFLKIARVIMYMWVLHRRYFSDYLALLSCLKTCVRVFFCQDYFNLQQLMEEASSSRDAARTSAVVSALVQHIMLSWREHFARAVAMKFNCFFLMPFVDDFPFYLRQVRRFCVFFIFAVPSFLCVVLGVESAQPQIRANVGLHLDFGVAATP